MAILIAFVLIAVAWVLSFVIRMALSRSREFLADAGSVELTKNPDAMITALRKIEGRGELAGATSAVMEMCVDNPREEFADLFATHPSVEQRVAAMIKFAGGHDPGPLALPEPGENQSEDQQEAPAQAPAGPWGGASDQTAGPWGSAPEQPAGAPGQRPFLPERPPIEPTGGAAGDEPGPWGPHRG